jgi:electron transfer flavoprotein alpha subunit
VSGEIWIIGDLDEERLRPSSAGVATLARQVADVGGLGVEGIVLGARPAGAAAELAAYVPHVLSVSIGPDDGYLSPTALARALADLVHERGPRYVVVAATPGGKELAGALSASTGWGVLGNAVDIGWDDGPIVHTLVFRDDTRVRSAFTSGHGIVTVQPNITSPIALDAPGLVETLAVADARTGARVRRLELVRGDAPPSVESARVIVAGGAGVGSAEAWTVVEQLAEALHGAVGSSRPPVDRHWVPYSQQVGQTGKTVRPDLYVALGISGEVQHRVGMRMARTVVSVNSDPAAPIGGFADLVAVGDLHEIVPAIIERIRRAEGGAA